MFTYFITVIYNQQKIHGASRVYQVMEIKGDDMADAITTAEMQLEERSEEWINGELRISCCVETSK